MSTKIKAILFDSGRVLNWPSTGHWFITPNFFSYVDKKSFNSIPKARIQLAFYKASEYISKQNIIINEAEEYKHFLIYYQLFFQQLPELKLKEDQVQAVAKDLVYNYNKYKFFKDAIEIIPALSKEYKMAVVSDAWPSLENVFKAAGLRGCFSSFVISSVLGVTKPHELMYKTALIELGVTPEDTIFIDDNVKNCDGAEKLGIKAFLLRRDWKYYIYNKLPCRNHIVIQNLRDIFK